MNRRFTALVTSGALLGSLLLGVSAIAGSQKSAQPSAHAKRAKASLATATLKVEGLHCSACVKATTEMLKGVKGVKSAQVDLKTGKAVVRYDPKQANVKQMEQAINKSGRFKAKAV